jgi:tetratricopeptide (TPR) repeat protein
MFQSAGSRIIVDRVSCSTKNERVKIIFSKYLVFVILFSFILLKPFQIEALASDPYGEASAQYKRAHYEQAISVLDKKKKKNSGDYNLIGWSYLRMGNPDKAAENFRASIKLKKGRNDSFCGLGYVALHQQKNEEAQKAFEDGLSDNPKNIDCLVGKATLFERAGNSALAQETYAKILKIDPTHSLARQKLKLKSTEVQKARQEPDHKYSFEAKGDYFWITRDKEKPELFFVKGVDLGFALPGHFPSEFPESEALYLEWFKLIAEMNANTIRVYTLLPPPFYSALKKFNEDSKEKLFLFQGLWVEIPGDSNFNEKTFLDEVTRETEYVINAIHGRLEIPHRYGRSYGIYTADASNYVSGFIFGQEWEPDSVIAFNKMSQESSFRGNYLEISDGNPMEVWLTKRLDYLISYEEQTYKAQRPVAFMNWPPLDPLHHPTEATLLEELNIQIKNGEHVDISKANLSSAHDSDAVSLDEEKIRVSNAEFHSGVFASSHVYPYYPDFLRYDEGYARTRENGEVNRYLSYLEELKKHYKDMPLLISEFGLPTSRGVGRYHPEGLNHGGLSEEEQADGMEKMITSIRDARCAGGIAFEFIDEWSKSSWMVKKNEEDGPNWLNVENPEENYGVIAVRPKRGIGKMVGNDGAWKDATLLYSRTDNATHEPLREGPDGANILKKLYADYDEAYLYLRLDVGGRVNWERVAYLIGINTYGNDEGDHVPPFQLGDRFPIGVGYVLLLHGENSKILVDENYSEFSFVPSRRNITGLTGYIENPGFRLENNNNGRYVDILTLHRRRFGRDGQVFPEQIYNASILKWGGPSAGSRYDLFYEEKGNFIEIRIPWYLLHFADPSKRRVILSAKDRRETEGLKIFAMSYRPEKDSAFQATMRNGKPDITDMLPNHPSDIHIYSWPEWKQPEYVLIPKKSYNVIKSLYKTLRQRKDFRNP